MYTKKIFVKNDIEVNPIISISRRAIIRKIERGGYGQGRSQNFTLGAQQLSAEA